MVALTIDQVIAKRKGLVKNMADNMMTSEIGDFMKIWGNQVHLLRTRKLIDKKIELVIEDRVNLIIDNPADSFNDDINFQDSVKKLLAIKDWLVNARAIEGPLHVLMLLGAEVVTEQCWEKSKHNYFRITTNKELIRNRFEPDQLEHLPRALESAGSER